MDLCQPTCKAVKILISDLFPPPPQENARFQYFLMDNSVLLGLLEEPFPSNSQSLPTVTAVVRGPSGRHVWSMQLRHHPRTEQVGKGGSVTPMDITRAVESNCSCSNLTVSLWILKTSFSWSYSDVVVPKMHSIVAEKVLIQADSRHSLDLIIYYDFGSNISDGYMNLKRNLAGKNSQTSIPRDLLALDAPSGHGL